MPRGDCLAGRPGADLYQFGSYTTRRGPSGRGGRHVSALDCDPRASRAKAANQSELSERTRWRVYRPGPGRAVAQRSERGGRVVPPLDRAARSVGDPASHGGRLPKCAGLELCACRHHAEDGGATGGGSCHLSSRRRDPAAFGQRISGGRSLSKRPGCRLSRSGRSVARVGQLPEAIAICRKAVEIRTRQVRDEPIKGKFVADLGWAYANLGVTNGRREKRRRQSDDSSRPSRFASNGCKISRPLTTTKPSVGATGIWASPNWPMGNPRSPKAGTRRRSQFVNSLCVNTRRGRLSPRARQQSGRPRARPRSPRSIALVRLLQSYAARTAMLSRNSLVL